MPAQKMSLPMTTARLRCSRRYQTFLKVQDALTQAGFKAELATVTMRPETETEFEGSVLESTRKLLDALENLDDVQEVFTNASL